MPKLVLSACVCLVLSLSACSFSFGNSEEVDKANKLVNEGNVIQTEAEKLFSESTGKYDAIVKEAQSAENTFEELANKEEPLKALLGPLETAANKFREAAQKSDDASKLNVEDWFKQYLSLRGELLRKEAESVDVFSRMVKITYDPSIETEEDFAAKLKEQQTALENLGKQKVDLKAKVDKLTADHKDDFKQQ